MILQLVLALAAVPSPPLAGCAWVRAENDSAGAGFVVDAKKKLLVTCRHVVADRKKVDVLFPWMRGGELVTDRAAYLGNRVHLRELGLLVTGTVLKTSDDLDLALVELESLPGGAKAVAFAPHAPNPGEPLRVVGNRLDLDTVWNVTTGPVRASGRLADGYFWRGKKLAANADVLIGQLPTEEGDSGGPVFDSRGELVGVASALRRQCPLAAVCISAAEVRKFAGLPEPRPRGHPRG
jgi:S1-C subfamily serine protease